MSLVTFDPAEVVKKPWLRTFSWIASVYGVHVFIVIRIKAKLLRNGVELFPFQSFERLMVNGFVSILLSDESALARQRY